MSGSLYFLALFGALALCVIGGLLAHTPRRACPRCGKRVSMSARRCLFCEYEFE
jgi:hypothetical protein